MTHIIIKTSKAKVLYDRDELVTKATKEGNLVGYSDDHVETNTDKYIFRIMPVAMPMDILNQIYDLGNVEGDADVTDIVKTLEADIEKIKNAISQVVKAAPVVGVDPALEGADKTVSSEVPTFTGNKIADEPAPPVAGVTETGETVTPEQAMGKVAGIAAQVNASEGNQQTPPEAPQAPQSDAPASSDNSPANTPNPQA